MSFVAVAVAGVGLVGSMMSADAQSSASESASNAQSAASAAAVEEQRRQFDALQKLISPFVNQGTSALAAQGNLLGLNGNRAQQSAIDALNNSAQMQSLVKTGENAITQNAAATGGLRGGNTQAALAQFRPAMLSNLIQQQMGNLSDVSHMGQASAVGVGAAGQQMANNIGASLMSAGDAQAQAALSAGQAQANLYGGIAGSLGMLVGKF